MALSVVDRACASPSMALPIVRRARPKYAAALLSPSCLHNLRVPGEFAARLGSEGEGDDDGAGVLLVSPLGKVWRVGLLREAGGGGWWKLGAGWAEFAAAHGVAAGWGVVLRLERRGVATVRAFDAAGCLARLCSPLAGVVSGKNRPRFIRSLGPEDLQKMRIPGKFVQEHLTESYPSIQKAMILSPLGKFWRLEVDRDESGVLLGDGWAQFLTAHGLSEANILVFRHEGNMVFSVEVFLENGCLKEYETAAAGPGDATDGVAVPSTVPQQGAKQLLGASPYKKKMKARNEKKKSKARNANTSVEVHHKKPKVSPVAAKKVVSQKALVSTGPQRSFTKQITHYDLTRLFTLKGTFCSSVGLLRACEITMKASASDTKSWLVSFNFANTYGYITGPGWRRFCQENKVKEGDRCTFSIIETRLWRVKIVSS